jgi:hypothetical protein
MVSIGGSDRRVSSDPPGRLAVIDLGTNSFRCVVFTAADGERRAR